MRLEIRSGNASKWFGNASKWLILVNAGKVIEAWPVTKEELKAFMTQPANHEWVSFNPQHCGMPEKYGELISIKVENNIYLRDPEEYAELIKFYGL